MAENLQTIYKNCVCNLDTVDHLISSNIHFEFDGLNSHICSCSLPVPLNFECCEIPVTDAPIIFQVNGNVSSSDSIITSESGQPNESSFWVECRPDTISRVLWSRIPQSLESIARASKLAFNLSKLCKLNESGSLQLRIAWNPRPVQKTDAGVAKNTLPVFVRGYPGALQSVLDGQAVQVVFNLGYQEPGEDGELYLTTSLIYIATV